MRIDQPVNQITLLTQIQAAGLALIGLRLSGDATELTTSDDDGNPRDFTPEEEPVVRDVLSRHSPAKTADFEAAEDAERLAVVSARAAEDPAFAALVELTLGKQGV